MLREFTFDDVGFILELLNEPGFLRYIGDKGVRTLGDAREYLQKGPMDSYLRNGFGLYAVCVGETGATAPVGMCGLVKREGLNDPDIGFAFLTRHWGKGYAAESAAAVLDHGRRVLELPCILAITSPDNWGSIRVLEKIGLKFERLMRLTEASKQVKLFGPADARRRTCDSA
jgi:[ribosomal protein S5]-alanine N-acetyltransferase